MAEIKVPIQINLPDDWVEQIVNRLKNDPEAEWVKIVRCKDCRHNHNCDIQYHAQAGDMFFCARAERRTDE